MKLRHAYTLIAGAVVATMITVGCSTQKNTAQSRWWQAFNARYNTYYNGNMAYINGCLEKENGNKDDYTELIPLYPVGNKNSAQLGKSNFDRAIEKSEKAIKLHSIKKKPVWNKSRKKTDADREWLGRREYNPFIWKAWLMLGKAQFQEGAFGEAAATFSYMTRLYQTQPAIFGLSQAWLAKSYAALGWLYDAENVISKVKRDSIDYRAVKAWNATYADYYLRKGNYPEAIKYLTKVIRQERRKKQKAREWFLMGQLQNELGNKELAYKAFGKVISANPPYETEFNARIAQTEVMAGKQSRQMISRLHRMAISDNNKDYLDQVYYAIGNIYLARRDTANAIAAYEKGASKATRNGTEKGVLLMTLGDLYWQKENYGEAKKCYGEAIGLIDKERKGYKQLSTRSSVLDELVPYTDALHLQDSLQALATMPEPERMKAIDRTIAALKRKEKEEKDKRQMNESQQKQINSGGNINNRAIPQQAAQTNTNNGLWYFYNPSAVSQGKTTFQRQWGKRENVDDWQRSNKTVVNLNGGDSNSPETETSGSADNTQAATDTINAKTDTLVKDPHRREYYLAQIPFTDEQKAESDKIIMDALYNAGVILKDKLGNLKLSEKSLLRLTEKYKDYEKMPDAYYHLFLLYSRLGRSDKADSYVTKLKAEYPDNEWTTLLSDPDYVRNARFGTHIEDSLYAATYDAFKANRLKDVTVNAQISETHFPLGENRPKFIFIDALRKLQENDNKGCISSLKEVVEKYPKSEICEMAGMILKGVQAGRTMHGGKFDLENVWERRQFALSDSDTTQVAKQFSAERNTGYIYILAYPDYSVDENQLLYELAKYNFTNFMVRNFDIVIERNKGISEMKVNGFLNYDEALQYARQLASDKAMTEKLKGTRSIIISEENLKLLGTKFSFNDYENFYAKTFSAVKISDEQLLEIPANIVQPEDKSEKAEKVEKNDSGDNKKQSDTNNNQNKKDIEEEDEFIP